MALYKFLSVYFFNRPGAGARVQIQETVNKKLRIKLLSVATMPALQQYRVWPSRPEKLTSILIISIFSNRLAYPLGLKLLEL